jgi:3-phenylpropionate/cinnamic acid dioxygenase small subunit
MNHPGGVSTAPTLAELAAFVAHEACCLDEQRWADWDALFAPDGHYWLPADSSHTDPLVQASHLYDDTLLRRVKLQRLQSPQAHSQKPPGRCHHLLQASELREHDAAAHRYLLRTPFIYTELRASHTVTLPGVAWHHLRLHEGALRIALKRVDLLHAAEALPAVEFYI